MVYPGRVDQVDRIMKQLRTRGGAQAEIADDVAAAAWRKDARAAARRLGRPVQTIRFEQHVAASLRDWPANELEQQVQHVTLQRALRSLPWAD